MEPPFKVVPLLKIIIKFSIGPLTRYCQHTLNLNFTSIFMILSVKFSIKKEDFIQFEPMHWLGLTDLCYIVALLLKKEVMGVNFCCEF